MLREIKTIGNTGFVQKVFVFFSFEVQLLLVFFSFEVQLLLVLSFCQNR